LPFGLADKYPLISQLKMGTFIAYFFGGLLFLMVIYSIVKTAIETKKLKPIGEFFTMAILLAI